MNEEQLRTAAICGVCRKPFGQSGLPFFYRVTIARYGVKMDQAQRQDNLAAFIGSSVLARVMSPISELTETLMEPAAMTVCETCAAGDTMVHLLAEQASKAHENK